MCDNIYYTKYIFWSTVRTQELLCFSHPHPSPILRDPNNAYVHEQKIMIISEFLQNLEDT